MSLSKLGEFGLINLLNKDLINSSQTVVAGIGDDAAVLRPPVDRWQLFTTDMLVEGIHFRLDWMSYFEVGFKALAVNISDIAAMGGIPTHALISLGLPENSQVRDIEEIYQGIRTLARRYDVNLVGGDTVKSPDRLVLNIALLGEVAAGRAIYRSGACPGDIIYTTGTLGASAAGLYILSNNVSCGENIRAALLKSHFLPEPQVAAGLILGSVNGVSALDDNSDGLGAELKEICEKSKVGCIVREKLLPIAPEVIELAKQVNVSPVDWILDGGEDYQLLFTVKPECRGQVEAELKKGNIEYMPIGEITSQEDGLLLELVNGKKEKMSKTGYNHFL